MTDRAEDAADYGIEELAKLGGVSRRTVRYYVQEGLLPSPSGVGRGRHYGREHLERLLRVKALQERGLTLEEVRRSLARVAGEKSVPPPGPLPPGIPREPWTRLVLAPGVELHLAAGIRIPPPGRLAELAARVRDEFRQSRTGREKEEDPEEGG